MKILFAIETAEPGGAETLLVELAARFGAGHTVEVLCFLEGWASRAARERGLVVHVSGPSRAFDIVWLVRMSRWLRRQRFELVHAHEFGAGFYLGMAARLAGIPTVVTLHGKNYWPVRRYRRVALRMLLELGAKMVAVSRDLKSLMAERLRVSPSRIDCIRNGIGIERLRATSGADQAWRDFPAPGRIVCLSIGALTPVKGHKTLIEALQLCTPEARPCALILGDGPLRETLSAAVRDAGLERDVLFVGHREDIGNFLGAADIFVLPSLSEGLPLCILEAMAARVPIVASDVGGLSEVIVSGESGILVASGDAAALARALMQMCVDGAKRKAFAERAYATFATGFSIDRTLSEYASLYSASKARRQLRPV